MPKQKRHSPATRAHMEAIADEVIGLPNVPVRQMRGQAALAGGALAAVIAAWLADQEAGAPFTMARYQSLTLAMRKAGVKKGLRVPKVPVWIKSLGSGLRDTLTKGTRGAAKAGVKHTLTQAHVLDVEHLKAPAIKVPSSVKMVERTERLFKPRLDIIAERAEEGTWNRVRGGFMQGVLREETIEQVERRLGGTVGGIAIEDTPSVAESIASRMVRGVEAILERTIRTETMQVYNSAAEQTMGALSDANGELVWFKRWDAELDEKVCDECSNLHGDTVEVDEEFDNEDAPEGPPLHPNCRCLLTVWTEPRTETTDNEAATAANEE